MAYHVMCCGIISYSWLRFIWKILMEMKKAKGHSEILKVSDHDFKHGGLSIPILR